MIQDLSNNQRWGVVVAVAITLLLTVIFTTSLTVTVDEKNLIKSFNGYVLFFGAIISVWIVIILGIKLRLNID